MTVSADLVVSPGELVGNSGQSRAPRQSWLRDLFFAPFRDIDNRVVQKAQALARDKQRERAEKAAKR